jgi:CheY-like chemotaxis protein
VRVLLAEDNFVSRKVLLNLFAYLRVQCVAVENGKDALDEFTKSVSEDHKRFDIVFLDVEMPVMGGPEAAYRIRALEEAHKKVQVPIIGLSGHDSSESQALFGPTVTLCVTKPITREVLIAVLEDNTMYVDRSCSVSSGRSLRKDSGTSEGIPAEFEQPTSHLINYNPNSKRISTS